MVLRFVPGAAMRTVRRKPEMDGSIFQKASKLMLRSGSTVQRACWQSGEAPVMRNLRMAAIHVTDLVQLDFANVGHPDLENVVFAWGHALKLAGAELLEIDHREIGVVFGPIGAHSKIGIQLFDNTAGGAGHVLELAASGKAWLARAQAVMYRDAEHHARCESACLQCLLTAASQGDFEAGRLHRRLAHKTMEELREGCVSDKGLTTRHTGDSESPWCSGQSGSFPDASVRIICYREAN